MSASGLLAHRLAGAGETVLFLNGGMMSYSAWEEVTRPLEASHRVLRCDLRGQLLSPGPVPSSLVGQVEEVVGLLCGLGVDRVHAVGASFGAGVGLLLAALYPDRVSSLTLVTATDRLTPSMVEDIAALRATCREALKGGSREAVFDALLPTAFSRSYREANRERLEERRRQVTRLPDAWFESLEGLLASLEEHDPRPYLSRIRCPTLVVAAGQDEVFPLEHSRALTHGIAGAALAIVEGSGHALIVEKPRELREVLTQFLATVPRQEVRP